MVTFYECLQQYYKQPGAVQFSKKRIKRMSGYCKYVYENRDDKQPPQYVESIEDGQTFTVRAYPDKFERFIMEVIIKAGIAQAERELHKDDAVVYMTSALAPIAPIIKNMEAAQEAQEGIRNNRGVRKRIPIVKPAYSAKPKNL